MYEKPLKLFNLCTIKDKTRDFREYLYVVPDEPFWLAVLTYNDLY